MESIFENELVLNIYTNIRFYVFTYLLKIKFMFQLPYNSSRNFTVTWRHILLVGPGYD